MSERISRNKSGLYFGAIFAASHAAWIAFVTSGISEAAVAKVARTNFVAYTESLGFNLSLAVQGLLIAFIAGYLMGALFAELMNKV